MIPLLPITGLSQVISKKKLSLSITISPYSFNDVIDLEILVNSERRKIDHLHHSWAHLQFTFL